MTVRIGIAGAGLIGRRHAEAAAGTSGAAIAAIADPAPAGLEVAARHGVPCRASLAEMLDRDTPDGVILATPNAAHVEGALACIAAGVPVLVEKPLATDLDDAGRIVASAQASGVPVMVGHHRRHNPLIARAREIVASGRLGRITVVQATTWFRKPDEYFETAWRTRSGAGPVYLNLIHDIDLLRHLVGEIVSVQAVTSSAARGLEVEDTAAMILGFDGGALGTLSVTDTAAAPWSWELTARENPAYPSTGEACYLIGGTIGSLALPDLVTWSHAGGRGWWDPICATREPVAVADPLVLQVRHFAAVIRGEVEPLVPAAEGLANQRVIEAIHEAARTGRPVQILPGG